MNTREIREPLRKIVGWPVENKLLGALGLVLFVITFTVLALARLMLRTQVRG